MPARITLGAESERQPAAGGVFLAAEVLGRGGAADGGARRVKGGMASGEQRMEACTGMRPGAEAQVLPRLVFPTVCTDPAAKSVAVWPKLWRGLLKTEEQYGCALRCSSRLARCLKS